MECFLSLEPKDYKQQKHWRQFVFVLFFVFFIERIDLSGKMSVSRLDSSCFMFVNSLSVWDYFSALTLD